MSAERVTTTPSEAPSLTPVAQLPGTRVLAWSDETLYVSRGYSVERATIRDTINDWQRVGYFSPPVWRRFSSKTKLTHRLVRDGFHALAVFASGHLVGAVPGAIVTLAPGENNFRITHEVVRGTRPLHITATPNGRLYWGEYFDNPYRGEVHIYTSVDYGATWHVAHTFPKGAIRHVHNIVYDEWENCLWILTGDYGTECQILRASVDLKKIDVAISGNQQARAVAMVPIPEGLYFASDTPLEANHLYRLDRSGELTELSAVSSSSIYGCRVGSAIFFSTMVEPSKANSDCYVRLYAGRGDASWRPLLGWKKDRWPMRLFQYGNAFLPDGRNQTEYLALTTIAVKGADLITTIFRVS
jgi:hypothetical protein